MECFLLLLLAKRVHGSDIGSSESETCKAVAFDGEKNVVMNINGNFSTSVDGITWTKFKYSGVYISIVSDIIRACWETGMP